MHTIHGWLMVGRWLSCGYCAFTHTLMIINIYIISNRYRFDMVVGDIFQDGSIWRNTERKSEKNMSWTYCSALVIMFSVVTNQILPSLHNFLQLGVNISESYFPEIKVKSSSTGWFCFKSNSKHSSSSLLLVICWIHSLREAIIYQ